MCQNLNEYDPFEVLMFDFNDEEWLVIEPMVDYDWEKWLELGNEQSV